MKQMVIDGNEAAAYISYAFTEVAAIYPITPSSPMAEKTDEWAAKGKKNLFGQEVSLVEMQSEAGAIGALHGALEAGVYATSYTSSQGLLLMIPVMHRIAGSRLPAVLHVASRTVGTHAMSIFGDHSDVMNCRQCGFAQISAGSVQEVMDLGAVAHLAAMACQMPVMHFFDGFRTSHEIQKIDLLDYEDLAPLVDWEAVKRFRENALSPSHPTLRNTVQNPDIYFQVREAHNGYYDHMIDAVDEAMKKISKLTGRPYELFQYYGAADAEHIIVAMGSAGGAIQETVEALNRQGAKVGFVQVHLYRPFSVKHFLHAVPGTVRTISVLDRTKEAGAIGEPLYEDICAAYANRPDAPVILGGRYGLSSKDTTPAQMKAVFENREKTPFTIGIVDDVTHLSLPVKASGNMETPGTVSCKFWGLGSDGTVGANKNTIKIIGDYTDQFVQAYFEYDTKKSYGITKSHLRFGKSPIRSTYLVGSADFVACHNPSFLEKYDILSDLKQGGTFLLNCDYSRDQLEEKLPVPVKKQLAGKGAAFYIIDANAIARELGLGNYASVVLQAAFFQTGGVLPIEEAKGYMKEAVEATYGLKGEEIVTMNLRAIDAGIAGVTKIPVPGEWARIKEGSQEPSRDTRPDFIRNILVPINAQKGDDLPVSALLPYANGVMPPGTTAFEKRGIAMELPKWDKDRCTQCNRCAFVCPHAVIRPYLLDKEEAENAPEGFEMTPAKGGKVKDYQYSLQVSHLDCTGCGCCANVCPARQPALKMTPAREKEYDPAHWDFALGLTEKAGFFDGYTVKGSQFKQPLCEFSGACAGCGETPYAKILTQLFGDKMYWVNATGCSQAWGAAMPSIPYTTDRQGKGPAWANSLFENNAEFGFGMVLAEKQRRRKLSAGIEELREMLLAYGGTFAPVIALIDQWKKEKEDLGKSEEAAVCLEAALRRLADQEGQALQRAAEPLLAMKDDLIKKTVWMYGGDGWAYDIGLGGLHHVIAMGENINALVVDTEVYSNTGGQSSKATPIGAVVQFQSAGKRTPKLNLGKQMMSYGNVYVASVSMGADYNQLLKALREAESFPGPSVVLAYAPCIAHGIAGGMGKAQEEMKRAVASGYWPLYRYDPRKEEPFQLDFGQPTMPLQDFLDGELRYTALKKVNPARAGQFFEDAQAGAKKDMEEYQAMNGKGETSE